MKVIGINGSARKDGNTALIISKVFDELNTEGIETDLIQLADMKYSRVEDALPVKAEATVCLRMMDLLRYSAVWSRRTE